MHRNMILGSHLTLHKISFSYLELAILSISKFFVYCCDSDINFTKNSILTIFNP